MKGRQGNDSNQKPIELDQKTHVKTHEIHDDIPSMDQKKADIYVVYVGSKYSHYIPITYLLFPII